MNHDLAIFLRNQEPVAEEWPVWANGRMPLQERTYLSQQMPPDKYITSARTILFQGDEVMVIQDHKDDPYVVPGGRREPGETVLQTLQRELLEETGWTLQDTAVLGFVHFHHLSPKPDGYPYPYPDFIQVIFTAVANAYHPGALEEDYYVTTSRFRPIAAAVTFELGPSQQILLATAVKQYEAAR